MVLSQLLLYSLWIYSVAFPETVFVFFNKEYDFSRQTHAVEIATSGNLGLLR